MKFSTSSLFAGLVAATSLISAPALAAPSMSPLSGKGPVNIQTIDEGVCYLLAGMAYQDILSFTDTLLGGSLNELLKVLGDPEIEDATGLNHCDPHKFDNYTQLLDYGVCLILKGSGYTDTVNALDQIYLGGLLQALEDYYGITELEDKLALTC